MPTLKHATSIQSFALSRALDTGNAELFKHIALSAGQSFDRPYSCCGSCSLFLVSLSYAKTPIAKWLLDSNCNPRGQRNCGPRFGYTAIHLAVESPELSKDILPILLNALDPEEWSTGPISPLHVSVANRNYNGTYTLLQFIAGAFGETQPHGNSNIVFEQRNLTSAVLNKRLRDSLNDSRGELNVIDPQDKRISILDEESFSRTPLHLAVFLNEFELAKLLIQHGADVDMEDADSLTPLHLAASRSNKNMVELLLAHHSNPNKRDWFGRTPLMLAAKAGKSDIFEVLLAQGGNVDAQNADKSTVAAYCRDGYTYSLAVTAGCQHSDDADPWCFYDTILRGSPDLAIFLMNSKPGDDHEPKSLGSWFGMSPHIFKSLLRLAKRRRQSRVGHGTMRLGPKFLVPAALRDDVSLIERTCTELQVTDVETLREALIRAASWGRLCAVKCLLRRIRLYTAKHIDTTSRAYVASKDFPELQTWVLVDQATDQFAIKAGGQHTEIPEQTTFWSGIRQMEIPLKERYGRTYRSLLEWVIWLYGEDKEQMIVYSWRECRLR